MDTCSKFTTKEHRHIGIRNSPREMGCLATNGLKFEAPHNFENLVIDDAVLIVMWSGNEAFNGKGDVRDVPASTRRTSTTS